MTPEAFEDIAKTWLATAEHPRFQRLYKECVYQPQLELLAYLRANGFKLFIVTGGGIDFVRAFSEEAYDIPRERVIGSSTKTRFEIRDGKAELIKLPEIGSIDDGEGKPININLHIGRRPILAFGNSDGDLQMLEYTAAGKGARLSLLVHHDDATREYAYDRDSRVGHLDKALDAAKQQGWTVVSMKNDWRTIFPARCRQEGRTVNVRQEWRPAMRRFSISKAMALVVLIAMNCAAIRASMPSRHGHWKRSRHLCRRAVASRQRTDRRRFPARVAVPYFAATSVASGASRHHTWLRRNKRARADRMDNYLRVCSGRSHAIPAVRPASRSMFFSVRWGFRIATTAASSSMFIPLPLLVGATMSGPPLVLALDFRLVVKPLSSRDHV